MHIPFSLIIILFILLIYRKVLTPENLRTSEKKDDINNLIRQVYRWHLASMQDENPVVKMIHSNYAMGFIEALGSMSNDQEIYNLTGLDLNKLSKEVEVEQDKALVSFITKCPNVYPIQGAYLDYFRKFLLTKNKNRI